MAPRLVVLGSVVLFLACGGDGPGAERATETEGARSGATAARGATSEPPPTTADPTSDGGAAATGGRADPDAPRILFFGTSLTAGYGLADPESAFPARIQARIDSAGLDYRVVEAGVPGATSAAAVRRIGWVMGDRPVEIVVVELGGNDALRGQGPEALRRNLAAVVDTIRARSPEASVLLAGLEAPPNLGPRYVEEFRRAYRRVARQDDVILLPFLLEGVAGRPVLNQDDGIHPNARGHRRIAGNVWEALRPLIEEAAEDDPS